MIEAQKHMHESHTKTNESVQHRVEELFFRFFLFNFVLIYDQQLQLVRFDTIKGTHFVLNLKKNFLLVDNLSEMWQISVTQSFKVFVQVGWRQSYN